VGQVELPEAALPPPLRASTSWRPRRPRWRSPTRCCPRSSASA